MLRLHVCVDCMVLPFGRVVVIGFIVGLMFTAGAPFIKKWLVAPESDSAHSTALLSRPLLNIIFACGSSRKLFAWMMCCHALCLAGVRADELLAAGGVAGMLVGQLFSSSRLFSSTLFGMSSLPSVDSPCGSA